MPFRNKKKGTGREEIFIKKQDVFPLRNSSQGSEKLVHRGMGSGKNVLGENCIRPIPSSPGVQVISKEIDLQNFIV